MILVYCKKPSISARLLARHLGGVVTPNPNDAGGFEHLVCWGFPWAPRGNILNAHAGRSKLTELTLLSEGGVPVPRYDTLPHPGWLGRRLKHQGGRDFTNPPRRPAFWVEKLTLTDEWRFHIFKDTSLRAGHKVTDCANAHPWVRTHRLGWRLSYGQKGPDDLREMAKEAVEALGLDFGAVDAARQGDGKAVILEVNTRPGLDDGDTVLRYARKIARWAGA